ncbi:helix-turn-helix transcriptional regulator [Campylobacter concisus]|uniref:helix-turn-helix transcriptional regulator n=1 Tax=Campylobacter concisus TaxID=199 RepID=UPI0018842ED1|nr:helix-turn-helix transcriptional regulator [Campylobacter concisus]MBE9869396.1 helix-turn-helix transcriptional regulator [Campylobacter concisus]
MSKTAGEKLRDLRTALGLSQAQFGDRVGITRGSIAAYENNINMLTQGAKYKILQITGIGFDYFDTDMELWEAFEKYNLDPNNLKLKSLTECILSFFNGIKSFLNPDYKKILQINTKIELLSFLTNFDNSDCCFIKIIGSEAEPFAKNGEIIAVILENNPINKNYVIAKFHDEILVGQYLISGNDEIMIKISSDEKFKFSIADFTREVEILGVIKSKISTTVL